MLRNAYFKIGSIVFMLLLLVACPGGKSEQPVTITSQPSDLNVVAGATATFNVVATNANAYQWQLSTDNGISFSDITAATSDVLILTAVSQADNGYQYRVIVSNSAGSITSNAALLTVNSATTLSVVLQQNSATGALEGVSGVRVVRNASNGSVLAEVTTDVNGEANFGDIGVTHSSIAIIAPDRTEDTKTIRQTAAFMDVPTGTLALRFDRIFRPIQTAISNVHVSIENSPYLITYLPSGETRSEAGEANVDIHPLDIQSNSLLSMVVIEDGDGGIDGCGALLDTAIPASDTYWIVPTDDSTLSIHYTANEAVSIPSVLAYRQGVMFNLINANTTTTVDGSLRSCVNQLPAATYMYVAQTSLLSEDVFEGYVLHSIKSRKLVRQSADSLPGAGDTVNINVADIAFTDLSVTGSTVISSLQGTATADLDAVITRLGWDEGSVHYEWLLFSPVSSSGNSYLLPGLPTDMTHRRAVNHDKNLIEQEQVALNNVSSYDDAAKSLLDAGGDLDLMFMNSSSSFSAFRSVESRIPTVGLNMNHENWGSYDYGKVISNIGDLDCGGRCSISLVPMGTTVQLTAQPNAGALLASWGGDCTMPDGTPYPPYPEDNIIDVLLDEYKSCTVWFGPKPGGPYVLSVSKGAFDGLIESDPAGIYYDGSPEANDFTASFGSGTAVSLCVSSATASGVEWSGACSGTSSCASVDMDADKGCHVDLTPQ